MAVLLGLGPGPAWFRAESAIFSGEATPTQRTNVDKDIRQISYIWHQNN
jgi:hypothetical protein